MGGHINTSDTKRGKVLPLFMYQNKQNIKIKDRIYHNPKHRTERMIQ